jgi:hypothetical protein
MWPSLKLGKMVPGGEFSQIESAGKLSIHVILSAAKNLFSPE